VLIFEDFIVYMSDQRFYLGTLVFSTYITDCHNITEIFLKVINHTYSNPKFFYHMVLDLNFRKNILKYNIFFLKFKSRTMRY
jgi:hypothetical protein